MNSEKYYEDLGKDVEEAGISKIVDNNIISYEQIKILSEEFIPLLLETGLSGINLRKYAKYCGKVINYRAWQLRMTPNEIMAVLKINNQTGGE